jgi:CRISPR-associated protein Csb2
VKRNNSAMLALEVEFLTGVSVAATPNRREEPEWPPHPDRLFQALVAAWGRDEIPNDEERAALEWLEALPIEALVISAPKAYRRDVATVFVPPNDPRTSGKSGDKLPRDLTAAIRVLPEARKNRQPRAFPAVVPAADPPLVRYVWRNIDGISRHRDALARLAAEVTYVGHSHSLVRVAVVDCGDSSAMADAVWTGQQPLALRVPHKDRLRHLSQQYERSKTGPRIVRPNPSLAIKRFEPQSGPKPAFTLFDSQNVIVLADDGGFVPALVAFPLVAKRLRDALLKLASQSTPIPALLSGHDLDRRPTAEPHLAIMPLADVGWKHSQGRLMGLALAWPRQVAEADRRAALKAIAAFLHSETVDAGLLHFGRDGSWKLVLAPDAERASLRFERYARVAARWGTVLPMVLDRHPKDKPGEDLATIIATGCVNCGLPPDAVEGVEIEIHKHSPLRSAPSAPEVEQGLAADSPYRGRPLRHLVLTFARPIRGPLIIGAGRYRGLGLCLPLDDRIAS